MTRALGHQVINGIHFIRVHGTPVERARAHGLALRNEIQNGALNALAKKNEWLIRRAPGLLQFASIQNPIVWFYRKILIPYLLRQHPRDADRVKAISESSALPPEICIEAMLQPDVLMLISRLSVMRYLLKDLPTGGLPGCTSAVVLREWTKGGSLLSCRNLDYPIVGPWEKNTTVILNIPSGTEEIPHVAISTAGIPMAGLTAMNAEGMTIATHAHFGRQVSLRGRAVVNIADEVIARSKTIGQAVDIAKKNRRIGNWAFVVASARENEAVVIEMTPAQMRVRHAEDGFIAHTNYFQTDLQMQEALISGACCDDLVARCRRLRTLLASNRGLLEPRHMALALGDHMDEMTGEERIFGNTVSVVTTVKSAVFEPGSQKLWVSNRDESPTGLGKFLEFDMNAALAGKDVFHEPGAALSGYVPAHPDLIDGVRKYRKAYRAWHMENDQPDFKEKTLAALKETLAVFPLDGYVWVQAGIVAFNLRSFDEAQSYMEEACKRTLSRHVGLVRDLFLARCYDVAGKRPEALAIYRRYEEVPEPRLRKAYQKGVRRPFRRSQVDRIMIDLQFADAHAY